MSVRRVGFARWRSEQPSGGNRYDEELTAGLGSLGLDVHECPVTGPWPLPDEDDRRRLAELLATEDGWLVGNIVASAAPEVIADAVRRGRRVTVLMHYFPADDPDLSTAERQRLAASEAQTVRAASAIVVTSRWAADQVAHRYGRDDAVVAVPGVDPAEPAPGSRKRGQAPMLLWLSRLTPTKDPLTFVEALIEVRDLDWRARLVGPDDVDEYLTREVHRRIAEAGLADRVEVTGARHDDALAATWSDTDLLVHTSRAETYGMVISEALARGVPAAVAAGTGAVEPHQVGATFPPGDGAALADVLRTWLTDHGLAAGWRHEALQARTDLPGWVSTAEVVARVLTD